MSAPERIWRNNPTTPQGYGHGLPSWTEKHHADAYGAVEYIRSDLANITTQPDPRDQMIADAVGPLMEALRVLIAHTHECEREITEALHHVDFCGESRPLTDARVILAAAKAVLK